MKQSKIKKLVPKKLAQQIAAQCDPASLTGRIQQAGADTIARMRGKGYDLLTCLTTGEGVFVRDSEVVSLHIQLPADVYRRLDEACRQAEKTKRSVVLSALEAYLPSPASTD